LIFGILGVSSYYKGAVRSLVSLLGLLVAVFAALPLGPYLRPLVPKMGLVHPVWSYVIPPVMVFLIVVLIFGGVSFLVHHKVYMHYKYATDDYARLRWERLNRKLGLCVGILAGSIYMLLVGLGIYIFGYPAVQFTNDSSPKGQQILSDARVQLTQVGLDRSVSALDPMPTSYYLVTDLAGLVYNNPSVLERLANYPLFLQFGEMPEFQDIATDTDIMGILQTQGPVMQLINNPKLLGLLENATVMNVLRQVDSKDLYQYLVTGKSAKYAGEKILGRWRLLPSDTYITARRANPDMSPKEMRAIKTFIAVFLPGMTFMATPEKKVYLKLHFKPQAQALIKQVQDARKAAQQAADMADPYGAYGMGADEAARYGLGAAPQPRNQKKQQAKGGLPDLPGVPDLNIAGSGTWEKHGIRYTIRYKDTKGRDRRGTVEVDNEILRLTLDNMTLVFLRTMLQAQ
jgi:uncharacterized membrane protein required for colicin V production